MILAGGVTNVSSLVSSYYCSADSLPLDFSVVAGRFSSALAEIESNSFEIRLGALDEIASRRIFSRGDTLFEHRARTASAGFHAKHFRITGGRSSAAEEERRCAAKTQNRAFRDFRQLADSRRRLELVSGPHWKQRLRVVEFL